MKKDLAIELHRLLHAVRNDLDISIQQYSIRVHAALAVIIESLDELETAEQVRRLPSVAVLHEMNETIRALKVKPERGRAKDLRRIEKLAEQLTELYDSSK